MKSTKHDTPKILLSISAVVVVLVYSFLPPIAQETHYHHFANEVHVFGIPNFWNVLSNIGFLAAGAWGMQIVVEYKIKNPITITLFCALILTGFGSGYYHYAPDNQTLVWDRLPMTLVFAAFFAQVYDWYFSYKTAIRIAYFGFALGIFSVLYWQYTESIHAGDLRLYAIVQFLPILLIGVLCGLHRTENKTLHIPLALTFVCYLIAKIAEHYDAALFQRTTVISGHPLKHLAAALATACIVWMVKKQYTTDMKANRLL